MPDDNAKRRTIDPASMKAFQDRLRRARVVTPPAMDRFTPPNPADVLPPDYESPADLLEQLRDDLAEFLYYSGWRHAEARELPWSEVDVDAGVILLSPERSKNETGRALPIAGPIADVIKRQLSYRADHPLVFSRRIKKSGARLPIANWRKTWDKARRDAGHPKALIHDCRRTVVRNLIRAGVHKLTAMSYTGHKTRAVFDRYNIQSLDDLKAASAALARHVGKAGSEST